MILDKKGGTWCLFCEHGWMQPEFFSLVFYMMQYTFFIDRFLNFKMVNTFKEKMSSFHLLHSKLHY